MAQKKSSAQDEFCYLTDEERAYLKRYLPRFLAEVKDGQRFRMSKVQFYNDEPYDYETVFIKANERVYDLHGEEREIGPNCMLILVED
jgi:hypothetical protein